MVNKIFYKKYSTGHILRVLFLNDGKFPIVEKEENPDKKLNKEVETDRLYFQYKIFNESLSRALKQRGFLEEI